MKVVQFDDVALRCVIHSFDFVILIQIARAEAETLLTGDVTHQSISCRGHEWARQRIGGVEFQSVSETYPGDAVVAQNPALGESFNRTRTGVAYIHVDIYGRLRARHAEQK